MGYTSSIADRLARLQTKLAAGRPPKPKPHGGPPKTRDGRGKFRVPPETITIPWTGDEPWSWYDLTPTEQKNYWSRVRYAERRAKQGRSAGHTRLDGTRWPDEVLVEGALVKLLDLPKGKQAYIKQHIRQAEKRKVVDDHRAEMRAQMARFEAFMENGKGQKVDDVGEK